MSAAMTAEERIEELIERMAGLSGPPAPVTWREMIAAAIRSAERAAHNAAIEQAASEVEGHLYGPDSWVGGALAHKAKNVRRLKLPEDTAA